LAVKYTAAFGSARLELECGVSALREMGRSGARRWVGSRLVAPELVVTTEVRFQRLLALLLPPRV
jgi:hypothetical protein